MFSDFLNIECFIKNNKLPAIFVKLDNFFRLNVLVFVGIRALKINPYLNKIHIIFYMTTKFICILITYLGEKKNTTSQTIGYLIRKQNDNIILKPTKPIRAIQTKILEP